MLKSLLSRFLRRASPQGAANAANSGIEHAVRLLRARDDAGAAMVCEQIVLREPGLAKAWELLAVIALNQGNDALASERFEKVIELSGGDPQQLANAAEANRRADHPGRALDLIERALALAPDTASFLHIRVLALQDAWRNEEAFAACQAALGDHPEFENLHSAYLHLLNYRGADSDRIRAAHVDWARRFHPPSTRRSQFSNSRQTRRRLRIGYLSGDFRAHAMAEFVLPLLRHHDRDRFEVICYSNSVWTDEITARCEALADLWRDISVMQDDHAESLMRADALDILIDLSGHTAGNRLRLMARKVSPVQVTYIGYPGTTGLAEVDYRITDAYCDPAGASENRYGERLLRLPRSLWCYQQPPDMPPPAPAPFLRNGHITFGSVNSMPKLNPRTIALWSRLLLSVPDSRLIMASVPAGAGRDRILAEFEKCGIAATRISMTATLPRERFWALFGEIDIALDSTPYNGGATTCATLWMGVPVVSLVGELFQSRAGLSILSTLGLPELAAPDAGTFLDIARSLALDRGRLQTLRTSMRERLNASPLADCPGYTRDLEALYRQMWETWCAQTTP